MKQYKKCSLWRLGNKKVLASILRFPSVKLMKQLSSSSQDNYRLSSTDKDKGGKPRNIEDPVFILKMKQRLIHAILRDISSPDYLMSPVKKRSYVMNGAMHIGQKETLTLDIKKFFPSTSISKVYDFFKNTLQCQPDIADILTGLTTFRHRLPTGAPTSSILAFHVNYKMFDSIDLLCKKFNCFLSVYVDDITISGNEIPGALIWDIKKILHNNNYKVHPKKQRLYTRGCL